MQVKIIALAVAGLMSGAAFAQTSVQIGGKVDAGYQFARSSNTDGAGGSATGGGTTETLTDGSASTSRITFVAKEDLGSGMSMEVNMDLRFTGGYEQGKTGLTTSDKRTLIFRSPYMNVLWGVSNLGGQIYFGVTEKPYMISPKDLEIVKYGVSQARESSLTSRNTTLFTPVINAGPVGLLFHATHAFGDNRTTGASNVDGQSSGDVLATGFEWKATDYVSGGFDTNKRVLTSVAAATKNGMVFSHTFVNIKPVKGLKIAGQFNTYRGYTPAAGGLNTDYDEKNTNFVVSYNWNDKLEIGVERSHLNDLAQSRNSGKGWMIGGAYFLSKSTYLYAAHAKVDFDRNEAAIVGGKYDGTAVAFSANLTKADGHVTKLGIVKEF